MTDGLTAGGDVVGTKTRGAGKAANNAPSVKDDVMAIGFGVAESQRDSAPQSEHKTRNRVASAEGTSPAYLALIARFALRPIRTDGELELASCIIDELIDRDDLTLAESDYLDVLGDLVEKYKDEHVEMPRVSVAAMLRTLIEEKGVRQADVVRGTGLSKTILSLILNGKRDLTRQHIEALSNYFGVDPVVFLGLR
jgi:HTH-type transcriptional regulator / antitoxin HigA